MGTRPAAAGRDVRRAGGRAAGREFQTKELLAAATDLHRAIRAAIDPEAFSDPFGHPPIIELRKPEDIVRPWNPASEIRDRTAAAMAEMAKQETNQR